MPGDGEETQITEPTPESVAQGSEANNEETLSPGIKDRLKRFENKIVKERIEPLQQQLDRIRNAAIENQYDLAILGFEPATDQSNDTQVSAQPTNQPSAEAVDLLRYKAAYEANLPMEALPLITETSEDKIRAQIEAIKLIAPKGSRIRSPVPPTGPTGNPLPTFKRSQLSDGKFFAEHQAEIQVAMQNGRIIDDNR